MDLLLFHFPVHPSEAKPKKKNGRNYRAIEDFGSSLFSPSSLISLVHGLTHKGRKEEAGCMTRLECFTVLQEKKRLDIEKEKTDESTAPIYR